jgi:hypothetical protein
MRVKRKIKIYKSLDIILLCLKLKRNIIFFQPSASNATKITQIGLEMNKVYPLEVKGVNVWFKHIRTN